VIAEAEALGVLEEGLGLDAFDGGAAAWGVPPEDLAPGAGERLLSEEGFFRTYSRLAEKSRRRLQANGGLSSGELRSLLDVFNHHDRDGTGIIKDQSLMKLLQASFSEASDASFRPQLLELMAQVSPGGGGLDFAGFRRFCQLFVEAREKDVLSRETRAIEQTSFSLAEVAELRSAFLSAPGKGDTARGDRLFISSSELRLIAMGSHQGQGQCADVAALGRDSSTELRAFLRRTMPEKAEEEEAQFDFSEFLVIMRAIGDGTFASALQTASHRS